MTQSEVRSINGREISDNYSRNQLLNKIDKSKINDDGNGVDELWSANKVNSQFNTIVSEINSLTFFPKLIGETNDYNRVMRAINSISSGIIKIPSGNYDFGGNDVRLNKSIKIIGDGYFNTIINNGGFSIECSNCGISNLFINCPNLDNAIQINQTSVSNIFISNVKAIARDHCYLIESYNGLVQDVEVINCTSSDSIHGFISKAIGTKFINCKANNHTGFAFGMISDNIPAMDKIANSKYNTLLNCECENCGTGFFSYCRDKWNSNCVPRVSNNSVDGLIISNTQNPFAIGEENVPEGYLSIYRIDFMTINNVKVVNPKQSVWAMSLRNNYRCIVDNCILPHAFEQKVSSLETLVGNVIVETGRPHTMPISISSIKPLDTSLNTSFEILIDSVSSNKINLTQLPKNGNIVTVIIRSLGGSNTYGGFDTTNLITNGTNLPTQFPFNNGQITQWVWSVGIKKWVLVNASGNISF